MEVMDSKDRVKKNEKPLVKSVSYAITATGFTNEIFRVNDEETILYIDNEETTIKRLGQPKRIRAWIDPELF